MTFEEFKREVRATRGKLTKHDKDLREIYVSGTEELREFTLKKKLMGVHNIAWIATNTTAYQDEFTQWMADKNWKANKNELDLWLAAHE